MKTIKDASIFDRVDAVCELDDSYKCFQSNRYFGEQGTHLAKDFALEMCKRYGAKLCPQHPLGYKDCELLIGFNHNVPDNTLPIIWSDGAETNSRWYPVFKRYPKLYFNE